VAVALDSTLWLREVGLDVRGNPDWTLAVYLHDKSGRPPAIVTDKMTVFSLDVWAGFWTVSVYHLGTRFTCERQGRGPVIRGYVEPNRQLALPLAKLALVRPWLRRVEQTLEVEFQRDRPGVKSNVKGAAKLLAAWIAES
jgi:hypothetical protein